MPSECTFKLKKQPEVYYAGEERIDGEVILKTTNIKKIKQIKIRFKGVCKVGFKLLFKYDKDMPPVELDDLYLTSNDIILKMEDIVYRSEELPSGTYTWPFSFEIPAKCETSMESASGHIRYELSLKIENENKYTNLFLKPVTVIKKDDLNLRKECIVPIETVAQTTFCCGLFNYGPKFHIEGYFAGYAPGQWMRYVVTISKKDEQKEYIHEIDFVRQIKYKATNPGNCKIQEETVFYHSAPEDRVGQTTQINEDAFYIPATPPTMKAKYISVRYFLRVKLSVKCCPRVLKAELPIVIGTVPLKESLNVRHQNTAVQTSGGQYLITPTRYQRPDAQESSFIDKDTNEMNRVDDFMPIYPTYEFI